MQLRRHIMTQPPRLPVHRGGQRRVTARQRARRGTCAALVAFTSVSVFTAPSAVADLRDILSAAVQAARAPSCGPLRSSPVVDEAAEIIGESTDKWINHTARAIPVTDPLPVLKDLGFEGTKAELLTSAKQSDAEAVEALLVQGYLAVPNCQYTELGVSTLYNAYKDVILMTVVLAG